MRAKGVEKRALEREMQASVRVDRQERAGHTSVWLAAWVDVRSWRNVAIDSLKA